MKGKYRIVTDAYAGFEVQYKPWYGLFWEQLNFTNTSVSIDDAIEKIEKDKKHKEQEKYRRNFKSKVIKEVV